MPLCKNCQAGLNGAYCSTCGQKDVDLERPILGLLGGVIKETFELDGRSALTVKTLFRHPGLLTSEFLDGRRRRYTSPLRLYLVISIAFFVVVAWLAQSGILLEPGQDPGFDAAVQARFLSVSGVSLDTASSGDDSAYRNVGGTSFGAPVIAGASNISDNNSATFFAPIS